ncbi:MAG: archaeosortase/exosortase family protein [Planctomycetaceae bacterium]|jgi:exosortase|nr:archaeosortase/exosortase family protein [Planctomycetaceae bacterium]
MNDNNNFNQPSTNPFQLNLNEIRSANKTDEPVEPDRRDTEKKQIQQSERQESSLPQQSVTEPSSAPEASASVPIAQEESPFLSETPIREAAKPEPNVRAMQSASNNSLRQTTVSTEKKASAANYETSQKPQSTVRFAALTILMVAVLVVSYWDTLKSLANTWRDVVDYHHGFFVVPFVIYFLWMRRNTIPQKQSKRDSILGLVFGMAILAIWAAMRYYIMVYSMVTLDAWTILVWICAATLICFGCRIFLWAAPSLLFLAFMFPCPQSFEIALRPKLQELAAQLSAYMLRILGEPAIRQVNVIIMSDNQKLDVAAACSGIRVLISVIAAAYAAALLMRRPWWINVLLFCLVIPVALFVNALRITITGLLIKYASGFIDSFHFKKNTPVVCDDISGGIMLFLTFVIFICIILWIGKVFHKVELEPSPKQHKI